MQSQALYQIPVSPSKVFCPFCKGAFIKTVLPIWLYSKETGIPCATTKIPLSVCASCRSTFVLLPDTEKIRFDVHPYTPCFLASDSPISKIYMANIIFTAPLPSMVLKLMKRQPQALIPCLAPSQPPLPRMSAISPSRKKRGVKKKKDFGFGIYPMRGKPYGGGSCTPK